MRVLLLDVPPTDGLYIQYTDLGRRADPFTPTNSIDFSQAQSNRDAQGRVLPVRLFIRASKVGGRFPTTIPITIKIGDRSVTKRLRVSLINTKA